MYPSAENSKFIYKASPGYVVREIAGEFLLVPVMMQASGDDQIAVMNETGKFLWERLLEGSSAEELLSSLLAEYDVSEEDARTDIGEFLENLSERNLLQESRGD